MPDAPNQDAVGKEPDLLTVFIHCMDCGARKIAPRGTRICDCHEDGILGYLEGGPASRPPRDIPDDVA